MRFSKKISGGDEGIRLSRELRAAVIRGSDDYQSSFTTAPLRIPSKEKSKTKHKVHFLIFGGDEGIRTLDPLLAGQVLSQLSYTPELFSVVSFPLTQSLKIE